MNDRATYTDKRSGIRVSGSHPLALALIAALEADRKVEEAAPPKIILTFEKAGRRYVFDDVTVVREWQDATNGDTLMTIRITEESKAAMIEQRLWE